MVTGSGSSSGSSDDEEEGAVGGAVGGGGGGNDDDDDEMEQANDGPRNRYQPRDDDSDADDDGVFGDGESGMLNEGKISYHHISLIEFC